MNNVDVVSTKYPELTDKATVGLRYDEGKDKFELLPPEAELALAHHYTVGALKYADRNWELGMDWTKPFACIRRHAWKWFRGEEYDDETGSHHMICIMWNAAAIYTYFVRGVGKDTRPPIKNVQPLWQQHKLKPRA